MEEIFKYKYDDLFNPTLQALKKLGGSGSISEIEDEVATILSLSEEEANDIHKDSTTKLSYRLAWARNYLKRYGLIDNSSRGVWALTKNINEIEEVNQNEVKKFVKEQNKEKKNLTDIADDDLEDIQDEEINWKEELLEILQNIEPDKFENLCKRILRELGFVNVEVTGKVGDGGIDGKGILKIGNVLSFHILFQSKRYKGSVGSGAIRDFRGAMVGRADKGLVITTGTFTRDAKNEAQRDGATPIDLIDGQELAKIMKDLKLGIDVELVEKITIKKEWFENF